MTNTNPVTCRACNEIVTAEDIENADNRICIMCMEDYRRVQAALDDRAEEIRRDLGTYHANSETNSGSNDRGV